MCSNKSSLQRPLSKGAVVIKPITLLFLTGLLSTPLVFAEFIEESELPPPEPTVEQILAKENRARVIVGLDGSHLVNGPRSSGNSSSDSVESLQNAFVQDLEETGLIGIFDNEEDVVKTKFNSIPALVMEVNPFLFQGIKNHPLVSKIEVDRLYSSALFESIPLIGADKAWLQGYSGSGQVIAIIDKGIDKNHPALAGKVIAEACFSTNDVDKESLCPNGLEEQIGSGSADPCDDLGCDHGTHVAGIAAANGTMIQGVAKDAQLIAIQIFTRVHDSETCWGEPSCLRTYESNIIRALEYVLELYEGGMTNIASTNLSIGAGLYFEPCDEDYLTLKTVIDNLREVGIASIFSAGNFGEYFKNAIGAPACISTAISVGATCDMANDGTNSAYNNYFCPGGTDTVALFSSSAYFLDLLAPGMWITSTVLNGELGTKPGTSMAAPHVAGAWAVLKSINPDATVDHILDTLTQTGIPIRDAWNGLIKPRVQLGEAIDLVSIKPLAVTLPNLAVSEAVVSEEEGFQFMWEQAAELDSGGGMNLVCAKMENGIFTEPVKINHTLKAAMDNAFYPSGGVKGVKYCTLEEVNDAGACTLHCEATVVISEEPSAISDVKAAKKLCRQYDKNLAQTKSCLNF